MHKVMILHKFKLSTNCIVSKQTACLTKVQTGQQDVKSCPKGYQKISKPPQVQKATQSCPRDIKNVKEVHKVCRKAGICRVNMHCKQTLPITSFSSSYLFSKVQILNNIKLMFSLSREREKRKRKQAYSRFRHEDKEYKTKTVNNIVDKRQRDQKIKTLQTVTKTQQNCLPPKSL